MKAVLVPIFFKRDVTDKFERQLGTISQQLSELATLTDPIALGDQIPSSADAVVFPEILGEAYEHIEDFQAIALPILILTSEFMTISMWDWEIMNFLKAKGVPVLAPYNRDQSKKICRALALRRNLHKTTFLIFQDNPGEGFQPDIFKCFYWWGSECTQLLHDRFGITIERRSLEELGKREREISNEDADEEVVSWSFPIEETLPRNSLRTAARYYLAVKKELSGRDDIKAVGSNCLNESRYSSSTPCIAWNLLFEREHLLWACEGDTLSLATKFILHHILEIPVMMTNIYPVLMGMAALKHEGIPAFPEILDEPENHILLAHCGYFGLAPQSFCSSWCVQKPVLGIVDEQAHVLDARYPTGPITMVKLDATMERLLVIEGDLKGYVQYPGSDCRNGAIVHVPDGHKLMRNIYSHHQILIPGHHKHMIETFAPVFDLAVDGL